MKGYAATLAVIVGMCTPAKAEPTPMHRVPNVVTHTNASVTYTAKPGKHVSAPAKPKIRYDECGNAFGPDGLAFHYPLYRCHLEDYDLEITIEE